MVAFVLHSLNALTRIDTVPPPIRVLDSLKYSQMSTNVCKLYNITERKDFTIIQVRVCEQTAHLYTLVSSSAKQD